MDALRQRLLPLVDQARGRCHSCIHQQAFDLPTRSLYFCHAFGCEHEGETRDQMRECPRWAPFRPADGAGRRQRALANPLFAQLTEVEDQLFWQLKVRLRELGVDLKTVLVLSQPSIRSAGDLDWIDSLDARFSDDSETPKAAPLDEIIVELRALRYDSVCELLRGILDKPVVDVATDNALPKR